MNTQLSKQIKAYYKKNFPKKTFIPGVSPVPVSGKVFDEKELISGVSAVLEGWWTEGRFAQEFEKAFAKLLGVRYVSLTNSGSSANLIAFSALTSKRLGERAIKKGDEVITAACGFPATVNPIIMSGCIPVFVDIDLKTKNVKLSEIKKALTKKTKAIMIAHTLGNPFAVSEIADFAKKHNLWLIEDCCDALYAQYDSKFVGTFGDIATFSFYPAHQITMGEGGAAITNNPLLHIAVRQFRDWGRDCWCDTGKDNTCGKRFGWKLGDLPLGYDHKYTYSQIGYNLKLTDMQAALGLAQLEKLPEFVKARRKNFSSLYSFFKQHEKYFILPEKETKANPSWFGFMLIVGKNAPFTKNELVEFLESKKIATRGLFAGNILKHPAYKNITYRKIGALQNSDYIMNSGFWIGVYPGLTTEMITYVKKQIKIFLAAK
ncbi:MAG TPA: lipopolysaccharide biosynthesis protein RfbH [Candidatus Saccharimonadales bacterium]|nr:lipopolysaccharide biosynthesis protein RfbH [Candidatus Saccharimonadales bacterium]